MNSGPSNFAANQFTVLVVDGDSRDRSDIVALLERVGFNIKTYDSAEALLEAVDETTSRACVISEMSLPGMSGLDLTHSLRARHIELIILTTHADVATAVNAIRSSVSDYLMKPFVERDLVNRLRAVIARHTISIN
jgi:two-component system response regulator FixJ